MVKNRNLIFIIILLIYGCHKYEFTIDLQNGYKLWRVSESELYIGNSEDVFVVGPRVESLEIAGDYIIGLVIEPKKFNSSMDIKPGYFLINTISNNVIKGLTKKEWDDKLKTYGITNKPNLRKATKDFKMQ